MKFNSHEHDKKLRRSGMEAEMELAESERELNQLFAPLAARQAAPELNSRLRQILQETGREIRQTQAEGFFARWLRRKLMIPLPVAAAVCAVVGALAGWVAVLEFSGGGEAGAGNRASANASNGNAPGIQYLNPQPAGAGAFGAVTIPYLAHPQATTTTTVEENSNHGKDERK